jgi:hypothetical protein
MRTKYKKQDNLYNNNNNFIYTSGLALRIERIKINTFALNRISILKIGRITVSIGAVTEGLCLKPVGITGFLIIVSDHLHLSRKILLNLLSEALRLLSHL